MRKRTFLKFGAAAASAPFLPFAQAAGRVPRRPNILLIMTDQQIADGYSARRGQRDLNTPVLDDLAARSRVYECAYTANPICMPARTAFWSGRYPHETGILTNEPAAIDPVRFPTLGTLFSRAGYETGYVGKWHAAYPVEDASQHGFGWTKNMADDGNGLDPATPAAAAEFIRREHEKPWLLVASFNNPHNICEWARGDALPDGEVGTPPPLDDCPPLVPNHAPPENETDIGSLMRQSYHNSRMCRTVGSYGEREWREYLWAYYRMIEKIDGQVGRILQALEESGQAADTLVVFTSDHGDMIGAHRWNQKTVFYEESVRIPLFLSYPGVIRPAETPELVNVGVDLLPTLCDFAGVPVPPQMPGISLRHAGTSRDCVVAANHLVQGAAVDGQHPEPEGRMVRSRRWKYWVYDAGERRESLFDLEKDPGETVNRAGDPECAEILEQHRNMLREWSRRHGDAFGAEQ